MLAKASKETKETKKKKNKCQQSIACSNSHWSFKCHRTYTFVLSRVVKCKVTAPNCLRYKQEMHTCALLFTKELDTRRLWLHQNGQTYFATGEQRGGTAILHHMPDFLVFHLAFSTARPKAEARTYGCGLRYSPRRRSATRKVCPRGASSNCGEARPRPDSSTFIRQIGKQAVEWSRCIYSQKMRYWQAGVESQRSSVLRFCITVVKSYSHRRM